MKADDDDHYKFSCLMGNMTNLDVTLETVLQGSCSKTLLPTK